MFRLLMLCLALIVHKVLSDNCEASTMMLNDQNAYECMKGLESETGAVSTVHWSSVAGGKVNFALEVANDPGFVALGFPALPGVMVGSEAVISKNGGVFTYKLAGKSGPNAVQEDILQTITSATITREGRIATLRFTRCLDNGGAQRLTVGPTQLVWAFSADSSQKTPAFHGGNFGADMVDLSQTNNGMPVDTTGLETCADGSDDESGNNNVGGDSDDSGDTSSCTVSSLEGFECALTLKADHVFIHWAVAEDRASISFAVAAATEGYVAVGFSRSGNMPDTDAVIGSQANGVETYELTGRTPGTVNPDASQSLLSSSVEYDASTGVTLLRFSRALDNGGLSIIDLSAHTDMVWAYAADDSPDVKDHGPNKGRFKINFKSGEAGVTDGFNTVLLHGALMVAAWALLVPGGVLIARFGKPLGDIWFKLHRGVQSLALLTATVGLIVAVTEFDGMDSTHRSLGIALIVVAFSQPLNALLRPHPDTQRRAKWNMLHHLLGRAAVVMGFVNLFLGLDKAEEQDGVLDSYKTLRGLVYFGIFGSLVIGVVLEVKKRQAGGSGGARYSAQLGDAAL